MSSHTAESSDYHDSQFIEAAIQQAQEGLAGGGIPIGSVLAIDGEIVGRGHNQRVQKGSPVLHAEMDCLQNAGRLKPADYKRAVLYSTLSPCDMCSGAILLYKIPIVVIARFRAPKTICKNAAWNCTYWTALYVLT